MKKLSQAIHCHNQNDNTLSTTFLSHHHHHYQGSWGVQKNFIEGLDVIISTIL